jgi:hypothetical protein
MKKSILTASRIKSVVVLTAGLVLVFSPLARAQNGPGPGGFDLAKMRQHMLQRLREQLDVKDESEWKIISERIQKVMEIRRSLGGPGGPGPGFMGPGGPPPRVESNNAPEGPSADNSGPPEPSEGPSASSGVPAGFNHAASPELEALHKAIEAKASSAELKAKLAEFRAARASKEVELEKAQNDLKQVLSVRQEAVAVAFGVLK